jgi:cytochrome P450/nitrite reductase/ring-hydroxylating ferredoxin subunit
MMPGSFERVASARELHGYGPFALSTADHDIVVVRANGVLRAYKGRCPHQGALLGEGEIEGAALVCRNHRWRFDLYTGRRIGGSESLTACPLVERNGEIFVDVGGLSRSASSARATRKLDDLPGPRPLPLIGNLHQLKPKKVHLVLEEWAKQYGPMYRFRMGSTQILALTDPTLAAQVLLARPDTFRRPKNGTAVVKELGIEGVFFAEGKAWRPQRKLSVAALSQRVIRDLHPQIRMVTQRLKVRWQRLATGQPIDIVDELKRFTVDITTLITFGHDANTLEDSGDIIQRQLEVMLPGINDRIFAMFPTWRYFRSPADRRLEKALSEVRAWLDALIVKTRRALETEPKRRERPSNFIEAMLTARDDEGRPFSDDVIFSNLLTMLLAGEDTTAHTLAWAIHLLCDNPQWVQNICDEANVVLGSSDSAKDLDQASKLTIAAATANEAMRLHPVASFLINGANEATVVGDVLVPKGASVLLLTRPPTMDSKNFTDPHIFRPDRWLGPVTGAHEAATLIPFGSGPRMCPGRSLALLEMKTVLAMLCKNFVIARHGNSSDVKERFGFTMSPAGLKVVLEPRTTT